MIARLHREESGFSLVEMLVAIACSTIVLFGLGTVLIGTMRQTAQTFTRVDATRQGRIAIDNIENELHSACTGASQAPILAYSTGTSMAFVTYYGAAAAATPIMHVITWSSANNTLTDQSFSVTGTAPNYTQSTPISTNQIVSNVTEQNGTPVFQYFSYSPGTSDSGGQFWYVRDGLNADPGSGVIGSAQPLAAASSGAYTSSGGNGGLSIQSANNTVEVLITFSVGATADSMNNLSLTGVNDQVSEAISLRLTTPPNEYTGTGSIASGAVPPGYGPCQ